MSKLQELIEKAKALKGMNKPASDLLGKAAHEEQQLARIASQAEPLDVNLFDDALKNIEKKHLVNQESGFQLIGGPQNKGFILGEASDISRPPVPYKPKVEPEVLPPVDEANIPALFTGGVKNPSETIDINPTKSLWEKFKDNKGKAIIAGTALAGGATMLNGKNSPDAALGVTTQATAEQPNPKEIKELPSEEEKELRRQMAKLSAEVKAPVNNKSGQPSVEDVLKTINFTGDSLASGEALEAAQDRAHLMNSFANLRDSHAGLAYDIAGVSRPQTLVGGKNMRKMAEGIVPAYQERVKFEKEDPNSPQSQGYKELAKSMGFDIQGTASASDLEKLINGPLANIYNQQESAKTRKQMAADAAAARLAEIKLRLSGMQDQKASTKDSTNRKFVQGLRKEAMSGEYGKMFANFNTANRMQRALSEFAKNPNGYSDYASLMGGLKSLQGDDSVVREAEMRLGMSATSAINKVKNHIDRLATGKSLQPKQRQEMVNTIAVLADAAKNQYGNALAPLRAQAEAEGLDLNQILGTDFKEAPVFTAPVPQSKSPPGKSIAPEAVDSMSDEEVEAELQRRGL